LVVSLSPRRRSEEGRCRNQLGTPLPALPPQGGERLAAGRERGRFMESPLSFFACIGTMNHPLTRPPGTLSPSEGERDGVRGRFMESEHIQNLDVSWGHEPGLCKSLDCRQTTFRFMESFHDSSIAHWDHERW